MSTEEIKRINSNHHCFGRHRPPCLFMLRLTELPDTSVTHSQAGQLLLSLCGKPLSFLKTLELQSNMWGFFPVIIVNPYKCPLMSSVNLPKKARRTCTGFLTVRITCCCVGDFLVFISVTCSFLNWFKGKLDRP